MHVKIIFSKFKHVTTLMLFLVFMSYPLQAQRLTLEMMNVPLKEFLKEVSSQTDYRFVYSDALKELDSRISISVKSENLESVLKKVFANTGIVYKIQDKQILLSSKTITDRKNRIQVSGTVIDEDGELLAGVFIQIKEESKNSTMTDNSGKFTINTPLNATLTFSFLGMKNKDIPINGRTDLTVMLEQDIETLADVVVTGYQTISKERATGSFDVVGQKVIDKPSTSIAQRLVGTVAGLATTQNANGDVSFVIRGKGGILSNTAPLIVLDGFPIEGGFNSINPNDIESISVLKDAAAASIWGARASNGVIVMTSKKAQDKKKLKVEFSAQLKIGSKTDVDYLRNHASSAEMVEYEKSIFGKYGITEAPSITSTSNFKNSYSYLYTQAATLRNKFVYGEITEQDMNLGLDKLKTLDNSREIYDSFYRLPVYQQYNLSISSDAEKMSNYLSLMYSNNLAKTKRDGSHDIQFNYRGNAKVFKWLELYVSANVRYNKSDNSGTSSSIVKSMAPYDMIKNDDGSYTDMNYLKFYSPMVESMVPKSLFPYSDWSYNPAKDIYNRDLTSKLVSGRFQAGLTFKIVDGLTFESKVQYEMIQSAGNNLYYEDSWYVRDAVNTSTTWNGNNSDIMQNIPSGDILIQNKNIKESYNFRNQLNFNRIIAGKHAINFILGVEVSQMKNDYTGYSNTYGYDPDHLTVGIFPNGTKGLKNWLGYDLDLSYINSYSYHMDRYFSAYANLSYTFDNRYSISGSVRSDASNFITDDPAYRYSPFWSVGVSWNMMNESFMKVASSFIDYLKPRITYGCNGNADSSTSLIPLITMEGYNQQTGDLEASIWSKGNPNLRWEKTYTMNIGADFSFWKSRLYGKLDYYNKQGRDILANISIPIVNGSTSAVFNAAEISNNGFEFVLGSEQHTGGFLWNGSVNFAYNDNKVTKLFRSGMPYWWLSGEGATGIYVEGKPSGQLYSYRYAGVRNVGSEESPKYMPCVYLKGDEVMPINGSTTYDGLDFLEYQGTTIAPYNVGMSHSFSYKGIELAFTLTGKFGHVFRRTAFNYPGRGGIPNSLVSEVMNGNKDEIVPMPIQDEDNLISWSKSAYMSYLTSSANTVRLQELTLSYSLPAKILSRINMSRLTFYLQGNNLFTLKSTAEDPEYMYGNYRLQASYTFGLKCAF